MPFTVAGFDDADGELLGAEVFELALSLEY